MVFCGKPSKGCGACRARKVKCDQATPSCQRCVKANRICPGYRDQLALLFRDQSSLVVKKVQLKETTAVVAPSNAAKPPSVIAMSSWGELTDSPTDSGSTQFSVRNSPLATTFDDQIYDEYGQDMESQNFSITPALTDRRQQAINHSLNSFRWLDGSLIKGLDYDADISSTAPISQKAMLKGILAVGMANLSRTGARSQSMQIMAQQEYQRALKFTNMAISHPKYATDDATLTAILCMSLFEILTSAKPEKLDAFTQHTRGAAALLKLRGENKLLQTQYLRIFDFMRNQILVGCVMRHHPIPPTLLRVSEKVSGLPGMPLSTKISHRISVLICRINDIHIEDQGPRNGMDHSSYIIRSASALESELETLVQSLPPEYAPEVHSLGPGQYFEHSSLGVRLTPLDEVYHKYQSFTYCVIQNVSRYARLQAIEAIMTRLERMTLQPDFVPTPEFMDTCREYCSILRQLALDICATVPYLCGFLGDQRKTGNSPFSTDPAGGVSSLFPLWVAVSVDGHGSATCRWIENTFEMIGREFGIDQALALRQMTIIERGMTRFVDKLWIDYSDTVS